MARTVAELRAMPEADALLVRLERVVARERVRLHVQTVTEHRRISGEVRKERIEVDDSSRRDEKPAGEDDR